MAGAIGVQNRIAAKNVVFEDAGRTPRPAAIDRMCESGLAEIRRNAIELPPTDTHFISVRRINANGYRFRQHSPGNSCTAQTARLPLVR